MRVLVIYFLLVSFSSYAQSNTVPRIKNEPLKISKEEVAITHNKNSIHIFKEKINDIYSKFGYSFPDSLADGIWLCYYETNSNQLAFALPYKNNLRNGVVQAYYPDGSLKFSKNYKDGKLNGISISFHIDADFYEIGNYKGGLPIGKWQNYYPNGDILKTKFYNENGDIEGESTSFNELGEKTNEVIYVNGIMEKEIFWNRSKKITTIIWYKNGEKEKIKVYKKLIRN